MNSDRGNREWLNDYVSLKQINPNNPFTVPEGYFDEMEQKIVSVIKLGELKNSAPGQGFIVPENYFEELSGNISARINVEEALNKEATGFTVPENYFEELSENIGARINVEEALNKKEARGFTVPEGYFDNLQEQIQSRIMVEEALSTPAEGFTVPQDYFSQLTENILNRTANQQIATQEVANRRGVIRQLFSSVAFKYATAACVTLVVGSVILFNKNNNDPVKAHNNSFLHKSLSVIPVDEIQNYLQLNVDASDTRTLIDESKQVNADNLSNNLQDYLDTTSQ